LNYLNDMPTFYSLEDLRRYGIPTKIEKVDLSFTQAKVLVNLVGKVWSKGMKLAEAVEIALPAFKQAYKQEGDAWISNKFVSIAGKTIRNKFFNGEDMGRSRKPKMEAGNRNNKKDKNAIKEIIKNALSQLGNDTESVLTELGLKIAKVAK